MLALLLLLSLMLAAAGSPSLNSGSASAPSSCTLADCKDPAKHDQCRRQCGAGYRPNCTYCTADPAPHQCSDRCRIAPSPGDGSCPCPVHQGRTYCPLDKTPGQCDKASHPPCKPGGTCRAPPGTDACTKWYSSNRGLIKAPASRDGRDSWWAHVLAMRADCQRDSDRSIYNVTELHWTATNYVQPQMHPFDLYFYDPDKHRYTIDRYLDDLDARYGGVDSILLWPTWPNIGIDSRSQYDLFASLPGGLAGLRQAIADLHARGVKVLLPFNPWDTATRRPPSSDDATALAALRNATGSDGINADSTKLLPQNFYDASPGGAIEPEHEGEPAMRTWHTLGWGWHNANTHWSGIRATNHSFPDVSGPHFVPGADFYKSCYDSRWMTNNQERNALNRTGGLLTSYFNGVGYESWENLWGGCKHHKT